MPLIDFKIYKLIYNQNKSFTGSFRYSSIRNHKGIEQSRRDDLESIGYMLIFFLKGTLPWQGLKGSTKSKRSTNILNVKNNTCLEDLCTDLPKEFLLYMTFFTCFVLQGILEDCRHRRIPFLSSKYHPFQNCRGRQLCLDGPSVPRL